MAKERLTFICWHCDRDYSWLCETQGLPKLIVECPYCEHEAVVDLNPDRDETVSVIRSVEPVADSDEGMLSRIVQTPTTPLPTRARTDDDESDEDEPAEDKRDENEEPER